MPGCSSTGRACNVPWAPEPRQRASQGRSRCPRRTATAPLAGVHAGSSSLSCSEARAGPRAGPQPHLWQVGKLALGSSSDAPAVRAACANATGRAALAEAVQGDSPVAGPSAPSAARGAASEGAAAAAVREPLPAQTVRLRQELAGTAPGVGAALIAATAAEAWPALEERGPGLVAVAGPALAAENLGSCAGEALTEADTGLHVGYGIRAPGESEPSGSGGMVEPLPKSHLDSQLRPHVGPYNEGAPGGYPNAAEALPGESGELGARAGMVAPTNGGADDIVGGLSEAEQQRRRRISRANRGRTPWNAGLPHSAGATPCSQQRPWQSGNYHSPKVIAGLPTWVAALHPVSGLFPCGTPVRFEALQACQSRPLHAKLGPCMPN